MYSVVQKVSKSLLRRYTLPKFLAHTARTFGKVFHFTSKATTAPTPPITPTPPTTPIIPTTPTIPTPPIVPTAPTAPTNRPCGSHLLPPFRLVPLRGFGGTRHSSFVTRHSSLVIRLSSFVTRHSSLVSRRFSEFL